VAALFVWMNGARVGEWSTSRHGTAIFRYDEEWALSKRARALSLSLPITANLEVRGPHVEHYFDNLLPDNPAIRRRIRTRFKAASADAFDLLTAIGRDCVGAVQLLPPDEQPIGWDRIVTESLTDDDVETILRDVTAVTPLGRDEQEDFRISITGAQEKTALLNMAGKWYRPQHATPTTHILKLPLGIIGGFRGDFSDSVENEWLCSQFLHELELPTAHSAIGNFGEQRALIVTRFDRRWLGVDPAAVEKKSFKPSEGIWIARLPQEDFCQATGRASTEKYEADGGPSIAECLTLLGNSEDPETYQTQFLLAQLTFWLLAATDGHGKNFSLFHGIGGAYGMTPLYDVLSAWPIIGPGKNQLAIQKAKLAMAIRGKTAHYRLTEITARHWQSLAESSGLRQIWRQMQEMVVSAVPVFDRLETRLPAKFPERVYRTIRKGIQAQVLRFAQTRADAG
jgi:serine/threonine-protein kinase HipA